MASEIALDRLKEVKEEKMCIKHRICPKCGYNLQVTAFHDDGELDLECEACKNTYREAF